MKAITLLHTEMIDMNETLGFRLVASRLGARAQRAVSRLEMDDLLLDGKRDEVTALVFSAALNVILFDDLLERVPTGAAYVAERISMGRSIRFDHGALRTIAMPVGRTGSLPPGEQAFSRILQPLGYQCVGVYPLPRLRMTGRAYAHAQAPDTMPQFFVSELHVDEFDEEFVSAAKSVFGSSRDPLTNETLDALALLQARGVLAYDDAERALADVVAAFGRQHDVVRLADYEVLLSRSAEAAWIATEGNAFNHATDRIPDVEQLAERERAAGRPIKDRVEVSASGRVRQTAYRADMVTRDFLDNNGARTERLVPGSFYEFISRDVDPATGKLDLAFDSANATGIFAMTRATA